MEALELAVVVLVGGLEVAVLAQMLLDDFLVQFRTDARRVRKLAKLPCSPKVFSPVSRCVSVLAFVCLYPARPANQSNLPPMPTGMARRPWRTGWLAESTDTQPGSPTSPVSVTQLCMLV